MKIQAIRNATLLLEFGGKRWLVDPYFAGKGTLPAIPGTPRQELNNPTVELPVAVEELVNVDAVIVTHLHTDHFDEEAKKHLPKHLPLFAQNEEDANTIREAGFTDVHVLSKNEFEGVGLLKTGGHHGKGEIGEKMGNVCGVVLTHPDEKSLYLAGDTIWCEEVKQVLITEKPDVTVVNAGAAQFNEGGPIIMDDKDVTRVLETTDDEATVVAVHLEALNHCLLTRDALREANQDSRLVIPADGETLTY